MHRGQSIERAFDAICFNSRNQTITQIVKLSHRRATRRVHYSLLRFKCASHSPCVMLLINNHTKSLHVEHKEPSAFVHTNVYKGLAAHKIKDEIVGPCYRLPTQNNNKVR